MCLRAFVSHSNSRRTYNKHGIAERVGSKGLAKQQQQNWFHYKVFHVNLPVMVSADTPDSDATDWLRMEQAAIVWVNQGQHAILKH